MALYDPVQTLEGASLATAAARLRIAPQQAANLLTLARYLYALPDDYEHFTMDYYFASMDYYFASMDYVEWEEVYGEGSADLDLYGVPVEQVAPAHCGAVACALGHAPLALGTARPGDNQWADYAGEYFGTSGGTDNVRAPSAVPSGRLGYYIFSGCWSESDNTPRGAAQRILRALRLGLPEGDWDPLDEDHDYKSQVLQQTELRPLAAGTAPRH